MENHKRLDDWTRSESQPKGKKARKPSTKHVAPSTKKIATVLAHDKLIKDMNQKAAAIKGNPNGVRLINREIYNDLSSMAGYIGLALTKELKEFLTESDVSRTILSTGAAERQNGFGVVDKDHKAGWLKATVFQYIYDTTLL